MSGKPKRDEPNQQTPKGYEIPIPKRGEFLRNLGKAAKTNDFNIAIISEINRLIGRTGYHFAVCDTLGMPNWVVALTREEEDRLRHERGWTFVGL